MTEQNFAETGRMWLRQAVNPDNLKRLATLFPDESKAGARLHPHDALFQAVQSLSVQDQIADLWPGMRPVRMVTFNKSQSRNWGVPWHQDRVIAVAEQHEVPGYSNWSQKQGAWHCEPPQDLLAQMLFVRLHLDESTSSNGAMQIALGTHTKGPVPAAEAERIANTHPQEFTTAAPGDVLIMAMTLLHKSDPAPVSQSRRTIRIDYATCNLAPPLRWDVDAD